RLCRHLFVQSARATRSLPTKPQRSPGQEVRVSGEDDQMEIIGAAALIAVAVIAAAAIYGRTHRVVVGVASRSAADADDLDRERAERSASLARREDTLARKEAELETERETLAETRRDLERALRR